MGRITPACAGKSPEESGGRPGQRDHPRMCGEKAQKVLSFWPIRGSPPRMRGKGLRMLPGNWRRRITPAYAGKRSFRCGFFHSSRDHPRVCGEKALSTFSSLKNSGSPPHVRGKAHFKQALFQHLGITPACAGKSTSPCNGRIPVQDHPRMCGEKLRGPFSDLLDVGSPPHVRGKDKSKSTKFINSRITPACAGKRRCGH